MANHLNDDKLDLLADLIDPLSEIITDKEALLCWKAKQIGKGIKLMIKNHKPAIVEIMATIEGEDPRTYRIDGGVLMLKLLAKYNELSDLAEALFPSPAQNADAASSGPVMETTPVSGM